jgi:pyridoxine 4-dehydrogenase
MESEISARDAGEFKIGGVIPLNRLGFGTMRLTGLGIWGPPKNRAEAVRTLQRLRDLNVNFVDTADSYGPDVAEMLIREALHPYGHTLVATKAGFARTGPDRWIPLGRPEYLIQQAYRSRRQLGVEQIGLWQLHRIDPRVPRNEQFDAVRTLLDDGVIRCAGLSEVSVADIEAASNVFRVSTVQNRYNLIDRESEAVLNYCEKQGIGFIPWFPLAAGTLSKPGSVLDNIAERHGATPSQIAIAWLLQRSPVMCPIPGTSQVAHLEANVASATIHLSEEDFEALNSATKPHPRSPRASLR